jgi:hypothetical protein
MGKQQLQTCKQRQAACALSKIQFQRFLSGAMYDLFFFFVDLQAPSGQWGFFFLEQFFFSFFSTKIGNFFGRKVVFLV